MKKLRPLSLKISDKDRKAVEKNAKKYAGGNVSHWLREAALRFVPKKVKKV